jgi:outer membrane protein OmpA-like peptidoglycan-associated protein
MRVKIRFAIIFIVHLVACTSLFAESTRQDAYRILDRIPNALQGANFKAWINDGTKTQFALGDKISFNFSADKKIFVNIAYVDNQGVLSLYEPQLSADTNILPAGILTTFPPPNSEIIVEVEPPLGAERIYFVGTMKPLNSKIFQDPANIGTEDSKTFHSEDSLRLAENFVAEILASNSSQEVTTIVLDNTITKREGVLQYALRDIVSFFSKRGSRSISVRKLDADIYFESNSAVLSQDAKDNLDVWGESLLHPYLSDARFQVGGHTDDLGSDLYNMELSMRRASAVSYYLQSKFGIPADRLSVKAFGESLPKEPGENHSARAVNRRVEFRQLTN